MHKFDPFLYASTALRVIGLSDDYKLVEHITAGVGGSTMWKGAFLFEGSGRKRSPDHKHVLVVGSIWGSGSRILTAEFHSEVDKLRAKYKKHPWVKTETHRTRQHMKHAGHADYGDITFFEWVEYRSHVSA